MVVSGGERARRENVRNSALNGDVILMKVIIVRNKRNCPHLAVS